MADVDVAPPKSDKGTNKQASIHPSASIHRRFTSAYQMYDADRLFGREVVDQIDAVGQSSPSFQRTNERSTEEGNRLTERIRQLLDDEADHGHYGEGEYNNGGGGNDNNSVGRDETGANTNYAAAAAVIDYGADEVADRDTVYSKLSEVDRSKARHAVAMDNDGDLELEALRPDGSVSGRRRRQPSSQTPEPQKQKEQKSRITANVVETGSDTITAYMKSLSNHQVLSASDETILGRQIQRLEAWEVKRQGLEESLQRYVHFKNTIVWIESFDLCDDAETVMQRPGEGEGGAQLLFHLVLILTLVVFVPSFLLLFAPVGLRRSVSGPRSWKSPSQSYGNRSVGPTRPRPP